MDNRFKPIGGMFQGVRGSTVEGGSAKHASKLVKLNGSGLVDVSCLPEGVKEASKLAADLEAEISARKEGDIDLSLRQETYESAVAAKFDQVDAGLLDNAHDIGCLSEKQSDDMSSVNGRFDSVESRVSNVEDQSDRNSDDISALGNRVSGDETRVQSLEGSVASLDGRMDTAESEISQLRRVSDSIASDISTVMTQVSTWVNGLNDLTRDMAGVKSELAAFEESTRGQFDTVTMAINDLNQRISDLYKRLFPDG